MKVIKFLLIILLFILIINNVSASSLQAKTYFGVHNYTLMTSINSRETQIITNIPHTVLELHNTTYITGIKLMLSKSSPNNPLKIRFYKNWGSYLYELLEENNIYPSSCIDSPCQIVLNFYNEYIVENYDYAIGIYDSSTSGNWRLMTLNQNDYNYKKSWLYLEAGTSYNPFDDINDAFVTESITDASGNAWSDINHLPVEIYGYSAIPVTPQPYTPNIQPCESNCSTPVPMPSDTISPSITIPVPVWTIDYSNFTKPNQSCDMCIGNESKSTSGNLPSNSAFTNFGMSLGYCQDEGCSINDIINILYDFSLGLFLLSFAMLLHKCYTLR